MMYFKDEPVPPSQLDLDQLAKVSRFRESLGEEGGLYWKFDSLNHFEQLVRIHLTRQVQAWNAQTRQLPQATQEVVPAQYTEEVPDTEIEEDDFGLLDYAEILEEQFKELKGITERITKSTEELGTKMVERTAEIQALPRDSQGNANLRDARRLIARAAADMEQFSSKMDIELPLYSGALNSGMTALTRFITLSADMTAGDDAMQSTQEGLGSMIKLRASFANSGQSIRNLQETIATLPRMTRELNQAKRKAVSVLDKLLNEFQIGGTLIQEAETATRELLNGKPDSENEQDN